MKSKSTPGPKKSHEAEIEKSTAAAEIGDLSRRVAVEDVPDTGLEVSIRAEATECSAIALRAGLIAVERLEADLQITRQTRTQFRVSGPLRARIVQTCVVSLDPFESEIQTDVEADFIAVADSAAKSNRARRNMEADPELPSPTVRLDGPDPITDGRIDLGALVEEFFMLNLDPYPRKPGIRFEEQDFSSETVVKASPFAVLKKLKSKGD
jgi:uncharacterized metal-binding protein YceD (DUF177 family)